MGFSLKSVSLISKVLVVTSAILILAISFNVYWNTALQGETVHKLTEEKTKIVAEFIENNVIRVMEKGRHFEIHRVLKNYANYRGIWKITVFRPDGTITASTLDEDLGKKIENPDLYLTGKSFKKEEALRDKAGKHHYEDMFYYGHPVRNKPECFGCHDRKNRITGVVVVANSMKETDEMVRKIEEMTAVNEARMEMAMGNVDQQKVQIEEEAEKLRANELVKQFKAEMGLIPPQPSAAPAQKTIGGAEAQKTS